MSLRPQAVSAFWAELEKIAKEAPAYRRYAGHLLDADIPLFRVGKDTKWENIKRAISNVEKSTWSHPNVAIPAEQLDLKRFGFKPTRLAIPLPGERWGTTSWRSGTLHAHKRGPVFLVHDDKHPTKGFGLLKHTIDDVPTALWKRFFGNPKVPVLPDRPTSKKNLRGRRKHGH